MNKQVGIALLAMGIAGASVFADAPRLLLRAGAFDPVTEAAPVATQPQRHLLDGQAGLRVVQFEGPIQEGWFESLGEAGLKVVTYLPDYAYLVWGDGEAVARLQGRVPVRWGGVYEPDWALHPDLHDLSRLDGETEVTVQVYDGPGAEAAVRSIEAMSLSLLRPSHRVLVYRNLTVRLPSELLPTVAALPLVVDVEPYFAPVKMDEVQGQIMAGALNGAGTQPSGVGYLTWLTNTAGFTTDSSSYPIVDVTDDGIDDGNATPRHADFFYLGSTSNPDRLWYNYNWTTDPTADGLAGHGNLNASIVAGYNDKATGFPYEDAGGYNYGLGINPFGRLAGSKVFTNSGSWSGPTTNAALIANSYSLGARISSNSWGANNGGAYSTDCQDYDALVRDARPGTGADAGNQEMLIVFSAGNAGSSANTVGAPGGAKNVFTVGAAESYRPTWTDGCGIGPTGADSAMDIASFSSRGPMDDGRVKPDLVAPGTHIEGCSSQDPGYNGSGVCDQYMPAGQVLYCASSGTSHSCPAVSGAASLLYRYYQDHFGGTIPSPAMSKAYLISSTRYLTGVSANDTLPSNAQGYGELNLGMAFDGVSRRLVDQTTTFGNTGETFSDMGTVSDTTKPFRVTLAWTDAPGPTTGNAYVNNLDLTVTAGGNTYRGNVFSGAASTTGGTADARNNVESVFLPAGVTGPYTVTVTATNIAGDGVPGNADTTDQDFALVVYNGQYCIASPVGATATANGANRIDVTWGSVQGATEYRMYRSLTSGGPYSYLGTIAAPGSIFSDATVSGGVTYYYVVRAYKICESPNSAEASAAATGPCFEAPLFAGVTAVTNPGGATCGLQVSWGAGTAFCGGPLTYRIYRSTTTPVSPIPANLIASTVAGTTFLDTGALTSGTLYHYLLHAVDMATGIEEANTAERSARPTGASSTATVLNEAFATGDPPAGWTVVDGGTGTQKWTTTNPKPRATPAGMTVPFEIIDSDFDGTGKTQDDSLITPAINASGAAAVTLIFDTYYYAYSNSTADIDISTDNGATWATNVSHWTTTSVGSAAAASHQTLDITAAAGGASQVKVRFHYTGTYAWYWLVDNVRVDVTTLAACSAGTQANPKEASSAGNMTCSRGPGTAVNVTYSPACGATNHAVYYTKVAAGSPMGGVSWNNASCFAGASGAAAFDPGAPSPGEWFYFVVVGQTDGKEGSYGRNSLGVERPEGSNASWACNRPRDLTGSCP